VISYNAATLAPLMADGVGPRGFADLVWLAGATGDDDSETFLTIPEDDFKGMLEALTVDTRPVTSMQRASIIMFLRKMYEAHGLQAPSFGSATRAVPQNLANVPSVASQPASPAPEIASDTVNLGQVVDQTLKAQVKLISFSELSQLRRHYESKTGTPPPDEHQPTGEQLAGLRAVLASGRVPFVDFAVWSSLGPRLAKFRRTEASVFVGGELVTKSLDAPSTFSAWEESWHLFSVAMITLNAATAGALNSYLAGIKTLLRLFPTRWSMIAAADLVVRSERWGKLREDFERALPPGFSQTMPWDAVIAASSFSRDSAYGSWWHVNLVLPTSLNVNAPATEGIPRAGGRGEKPPPKPPVEPWVRPSKTKLEVCGNWNNRHGACAEDGPCSAGRAHKCSVCGRDHRACDVHADFKKGGKGKKKGTGKGKKGQKGQES